MLPCATQLLPEQLQGWEHIAQLLEQGIVLGFLGSSPSSAFDLWRVQTP